MASASARPPIVSLAPPRSRGSTSPRASRRRSDALTDARDLPTRRAISSSSAATRRRANLNIALSTIASEFMGRDDTRVLNVRPETGEDRFQAASSSSAMASSSRSSASPTSPASFRGMARVSREQLTQPLCDVPQPRDVARAALGVVDRKDDVPVRARHRCSGGPVVQDPPPDLVDCAPRRVRVRLRPSQEVHRLVARNGLAQRVSRQDRGSPPLQEHVRAGELFSRLLPDTKLPLRVGLERLVPPVLPSPAPLHARKRLRELDPARLEAPCPTEHLCPLGVVGMSALGVGERGVRLRSVMAHGFVAGRWICRTFCERGQESRKLRALCHARAPPYPSQSPSLLSLRAGARLLHDRCR